jgi:hypothetical protein
MQVHIPYHTQARMSVWEKKRLDVLKFKARALTEDRAKVRAEFCEMMRYNEKDRRLATLSDRVIKYDVAALDAEQKLTCFYEHLKLKYA